MNSMQEQYLKALNPTITIHIQSIDNKTIPKNLLLEVFKFTSYNYKSYLDIENGVIYIGKKG